MNKIPVFFGALLLACLPLPQFAGEGGVGLGSLSAVFILSAFLTNAFVLFQKTKFAPKAVISEISSNFKPLDFAVLMLLAAAFVGTVSSYFLKASLSGFVKYLLYVLVYAAFALSLKDKNDFYILLLGALIGLFWSSLEGYKQYLFGAEQLATWEDPNMHPSQQLTRIYSTLLNPNLYAAYLLALWPLSLVAFKLSEQKLLKILGVVVALSTVFLVVQTGSRGAWIALAAQLALFAFAVARYKRSPLIISGMALGALGAGLYLLSKPAFWNRLTSIFSSYDHSSNSFRLHVWSACLRIIADNPIFGIGPGSKAFYLAYGIYMDSNYSALGAYSLILETGVELGLIGLAALGYLVFVIAKTGINLLKENQNSESLTIFLLLVSLLGLLINGLFDIVILRPQVQILLWFIIGTLRFYSIHENNRNQH